MEQLLQVHLPDLLEHMHGLDIRFEMYASDWVFALYANIIPTKQMHYFFDNFFEDGWSFFYKVTLTLLRLLQTKIMEAEEMSDVLDLIKLAAHKKNDQKRDYQSGKNILQASSASLQLLLQQEEEENQESGQSESEAEQNGILGSIR